MSLSLYKVKSSYIKFLTCYFLGSGLNKYYLILSWSYFNKRDLLKYFMFKYPPFIVVWCCVSKTWHVCHYNQRALGNTWNKSVDLICNNKNPIQDPFPCFNSVLRFSAVSSVNVHFPALVVPPDKMVSRWEWERMRHLISVSNQMRKTRWTIWVLSIGKKNPSSPKHAFLCLLLFSFFRIVK